MAETPRKVCVVLVNRANYGRLKPLMAEIQRRPRLRLQAIVAGTMVLNRFDEPARLVADDGFVIDAAVHMELEGSTPATMAKSIGIGLIEFANAFGRLRPDVVLLIGDRYEALAAAVAAAYMNITIVHLQGGEVSGAIDESARHAITKFAQYHVPATQRAREYLLRMGEHPGTILGVGCPSSDLARGLDSSVPDEALKVLQDTRHFAGRFVLAAFHPTTTEYGRERFEMGTLLTALAAVGLPTLLFCPNIDAGADRITEVIRLVGSNPENAWLRTAVNFSPEQYLKALAAASCAVGNSSSFVRDASYFGTPVVLVGGRQRHREVGTNVKLVGVDVDQIREAILAQLASGPYPPSALYGDGNVATRIADALELLKLYAQKHLAYVHEVMP